MHEQTQHLRGAIERMAAQAQDALPRIVAILHLAQDRVLALPSGTAAGAVAVDDVYQSLAAVCHLAMDLEEHMEHQAQQVGLTRVAGGNCWRDPAPEACAQAPAADESCMTNGGCDE